MKREGKENNTMTALETMDMMTAASRSTHRRSHGRSHGRLNKASQNNEHNRNARKRYRIKSNFRFVTFLVVVLGLAIGAFGFITGSNQVIALETSQAPEPITIEVTDGDTVWDIANHFKSDDKEIRKAVYEICQANNIPDGSIQSGMILTIPENL